MWALRRASNRLRYHVPHGAVAQVFCSKSDILCSNLTHEHWGYELYGNTGAFVLLNFFPHGPSFSAMPSLWIRNLCSQSGATTSDSEVDDGFSDLDSPLETDKIGTFVDKEEDESKVDSVEVADCSIGSLDSKSQANGEKKPGRTSLASLLFKVVMEAPRHSVNDALNKWVKEGNSLGRNEISMTLSNLRKKMFYGKALQFLDWLEASKRLDFVEQDYASRLDLVAKVHGLQKAERYINGHKCEDVAPNPIIIIHLLLKCSSLISGWTSWQYRNFLVEYMGQLLRTESYSQIPEPVIIVCVGQLVGL